MCKVSWIVLRVDEADTFRSTGGGDLSGNSGETLIREAMRSIYASIHMDLVRAGIPAEGYSMAIWFPANADWDGERRTFRTPVVEIIPEDTPAPELPGAHSKHHGANFDGKKKGARPAGS